MRLPARISFRNGSAALEDSFLDRATWVRLAIGVVVSVVVLAGVAGVLAWRQYDDGTQRALSEEHARVVLGAGILDTAVAGDVSTLSAMAQAPAVVSVDELAMAEYFRRVAFARGAVFTGGIGWIDRTGVSQVSSDPATRPGLNVADRSYFTQVVATGEPYVSQGLVSRQNHSRQIVVIGVPTRGPGGRLTGVLVGALVVNPQTKASEQSALDLGFAGLAILDRTGQEIFSGLARPSNASLVARLERAGVGTLSDSRGLDGSPGHVVAFASATIPGWTIVIDRPRSAVFGAARRSLILELVSIGVASAIVLCLIGLIFVRTRRQAHEGQERARARSELRRNLDRASAVGEISDALVAALTDAFDGAFAVVALKADSGLRLAAVSGDTERLLRATDERIYLRVAELAFDAQVPVAVETDAGIRRRVARSNRTVGGRVRSVYSVPLIERGGQAVGAAALLFTEERALSKEERAHVAATAGQAAQSLARALRYEREHEVALTLQRSLLAERLPRIDGVDVAGRYRAGADGLEVGGDWYDVVRRADGIIHVTVGDVAGRGIRAAALMGELRHAFRAYAHDYASPADIVRRLLRHLPDGEMATTVCASIDPFTRELEYASAGHPPILLSDDDGGTVSRLDLVGAPPLGFADAGSIRSARLTLPPRATIVAYTDGLIERRGQNIDDGVELLASVVTAGRDLDAHDLAESILDELVRRLGVQDDIGLLILRFAEAPARLELEIPARSAELAALRKRLRAWLELRGADEDERADIVLAVSEACNNSIEHGYGGAGGTIRLLLEHENRQLRVVIEDDGGWQPQGEPNPERHRGIPIMRGVMDDAEIAHDNGTTRVTLARRLA